MQDEFWISSDGKILSQTEKDPTTVELILQFEFEKKADAPKIEPLLPNLQFSERSRLARIGIELFLTSRPEIQNNSILARAEAFVIDREFPSFEFLPNLLQPGTEVGRLFHFPETSKLSSTEIWQAIQKNELKLPETLSVDRFGQIHFTPHRRIYQLPPSL